MTGQNERAPVVKNADGSVRLPDGTLIPAWLVDYLRIRHRAAVSEAIFIANTLGYRQPDVPIQETRRV